MGYSITYGEFWFLPFIGWVPVSRLTTVSIVNINPEDRGSGGGAVVLLLVTVVVVVVAVVVMVSVTLEGHPTKRRNGDGSWSLVGLEVLTVDSP